MAANVDGLSYRGRCRRQGALTGEPQPQAFLPPDWLSSDALLLSPAGERGEAFNSLFTPRIALPRVSARSMLASEKILIAELG